MCPDINDLVVTLIVRDLAHVIVIPDFIDFCLSFFQGILLDRGRDQVSKVQGESAFECPHEAHFLDIIKKFGCNVEVGPGDHVANDPLQVLLGQQLKC